MIYRSTPSHLAPHVLRTRVTSSWWAAALLGCVVYLSVAPALAAQLQVVAVLTDHAWLVRQIGGKRVHVTTLLTGREDPHHVSARPSLVLQTSRAQLYISPGMELDVGYTPLLLRGSRNAAIQVGAKGYVDASIYVNRLQIPTTVSRGMGDVHAAGNPHYHLDPVAMLASARAITEGLIRVDAAHKASYRQGHKQLRRLLLEKLVGPILVRAAGTKRLEGLLQQYTLLSFLRKTQVGGRPLMRYLGGWLKQMAPHKGQKVITYHQQWVYFLRRFGLRSIGQLEPKPGIPPSAKHLQQLLQLAQQSKPRWIVTANFYGAGSAQYLAEKLHIPMLRVPFHTQGTQQTKTYPQLIDALVQALSKKR